MGDLRKAGIEMMEDQERSIAKSALGRNVTLLRISVSYNDDHGVKIKQERFKAKETEKTYRLAKDTNKPTWRSVVSKEILMQPRTVFKNTINGADYTVFSWSIWCLPADQQKAKEKLVKVCILKINGIIKQVQKMTERIDEQFGIYGFWPPLPQDEMPHWDFLPDLIETIEGNQDEL